MSGWIAVDFDGTVAFYPPQPGQSLGDPIPEMVDRIRGWLAEGIEVQKGGTHLGSKLVF